MTKPDPKQADKEFHRKTAREYDERVDKKSRVYHSTFLYPYIDEVRRNLPAGSGFTALDIGCGTGSVAIPLAERGFRVKAIDHSPEMVDIARQKAARKGLHEKIEFIIGDAENTGFPDGMFDLVTCQGVIHHLADKGPMIKEMHRLTKKGGFYYISEPVELIPRLKILGFLGKVFHFARGERSIEAPLVKNELLGHLRSAGASSFEYSLVFYLPYLPIKPWEQARAAIAKSFKNKRMGSIMFVYGRR